jgi:hypothetical protein
MALFYGQLFELIFKKCNFLYRYFNFQFGIQTNQLVLP